MTFKGKNLLPYQEINGTYGFGTTPADKLKIEIPINILIIERYVQQACISNLLVTVFAASQLYFSLILKILFLCKTPATLANPQRTNGRTAHLLANTAP